MTVRQFDVFRNSVRNARASKPFLLALQHRQLDHLSTRLVAPLLADIRGDLTRLNPVFIVEGQRVFLDPTNLASIRATHLTGALANLESERYRIIAALDLVFTGV